MTSTNKTNQLTNKPTNQLTKKRVLSVLFVLLSCFFSAAFVSAATSSIPAATLKRVTITDSASKNIPPHAVMKYTQQGETVSFDASSSSDSDGTIADYKWDFGDGTTEAGVKVSHVYSGYGNFPVTLAVIDAEGSVGLTQNTISKLFSLAVNFQPAKAPVPDGFVADSGLPYDINRGYGWTEGPSSLGNRDRNAIKDQKNDTLIHVAPSAVWSAIVPDGSYAVTVTIGDPVYPDSLHSIQVEGYKLFNLVPLSSTQKLITRTTVVEVSDGKLTLTFNGSVPYAKLCWVRIQSATN